MDLLCRHHYRASIPQPERARAQELVQELVVVKNKPFLHDLPDKAGLRIAFGDTMRRSIPRTGRNEPCHCGSGRKYKHGSFRHAARPHYRVRARFSAAVESCAAPRCGSHHDDAGAKLRPDNPPPSSALFALKPAPVLCATAPDWTGGCSFGVSPIASKPSISFRARTSSAV
jgi:hypothetical protein